MTNPLGMYRRQLGDSDEGLFVLPPQQVTDRRSEYFERGHRILSAYAAVAAYSEKGREVVESHKRSGTITPTTPIRLQIGNAYVQTSARRIEHVFAGAGAELTRQCTVAIYGNFEAFLADHVLAAFMVTGEKDAEQATVAAMGASRWRGKLDRIAQRFGLPLRATALRARYAGIDMGFFGKRFEDPVDFLQALANLRHRLVHSSGRVDGALIAEYPACRLTPGQLVVLPFELPLELWFWFVPLTDEIDRLFADRFDWPRREVLPESLI